MPGSLHFGQTFGARDECPQMWQHRRSAARWNVSETLQSGHVQTWPQASHSIIDPVVQADEPVFSRQGVGPALEARRGAAEKHGRLLAMPAQDGHVPRMVARRFVLLVGILVLLIHNDDAEVFERGKNRAAGADDDPGCPAVDLVPLVVALAVGEVAVQDGDLLLHVREAGLEPLDRLRRQRDFRHENQRGAPVIDRLADRAQVDLGLPRTGHAEKQDRLRGRVRHRLLDRLQSDLLLGIQNQVRRGKEFFRVGIAREDRGFDDDQPALFQHAENSLRHSRQLRRRRNRNRRARFDHRAQGIRLPGGALFERR